MISFKNKKILITGASGGIGNELVKKFVSLGGDVLGTGTNTEKLNSIKKNSICVVIKIRHISKTKNSMRGTHHNV